MQHRNVRAAARGQVTPAESDEALAAPERPRNDEPRELAGGAGSKGKDGRGSLDCAEAARLAQSLLRELVRLAAVGAIMVAAALAFAVAVGGAQ